MTKSLLVALTVGWVLITPAVAENSLHNPHSPQIGSKFEQMMSAAMDKMHSGMSAAGRMGNPDREFLAMMIPHHEGAVEMARLVLIYGRDPLVRQLAEEIIAGQQAEITAMQARLKILDHGPDPNPGGFPAISGTRGK
jgi:uncharacterized protein (DUF305 family)